MKIDKIMEEIGPSLHGQDIVDDMCSIREILAKHLEKDEEKVEEVAVKLKNSPCECIVCKCIGIDLFDGAESYVACKTCGGYLD